MELTKLLSSGRSENHGTNFYKISDIHWLAAKLFIVEGEETPDGT
jgi:hypothetical protein